MSRNCKQPSVGRWAVGVMVRGRERDEVGRARPGRACGHSEKSWNRVSKVVSDPPLSTCGNVGSSTSF